VDHQYKITFVRHCWGYIQRESKNTNADFLSQLSQILTDKTDINISQGNVGTFLRCGGTADDRFIANFSPRVLVKEFLKSVNTWLSYDKKSALFFWLTVYNAHEQKTRIDNAGTLNIGLYSAHCNGLKPFCHHCLKSDCWRTNLPDWYSCVLSCTLIPNFYASLPV